MWRFIQFLLSFSFVVMPLQFAWADSGGAYDVPQSTQMDLRTISAGKRAFLIDLRNRVQLTMDINKIYLGKYQQCFARSRAPLSDSDCASVESKYKNGINVSDCEIQMCKVRQTIRTRYSYLRRLMFLHGLLNPDVIHTSISRLITATARTKTLFGSSNGEGLTLLIPISDGVEEHPLREDVGLKSMNFNSNDKYLPNLQPSAELIQSVLYGNSEKMDIGKYESQYIEKYAKGDRQFTFKNLLSRNTQSVANSIRNQNLNEYLRWGCQLAVGYNNQFCSDISVQYEPRKYGQNLVFHFNSALVKMIYENLSMNPGAPSYDLIQKNLTIFKYVYDDIERKMYSEIQKAPYVSLVSSSRPSDAELAGVFARMETASAKVIKEFDADYPQRDLRKIPTSELRSLMKYTPIVNAVLSSDFQIGGAMEVVPEADYDQIHKMLLADYQSDEFKRAGLDFVELIFANVAVCWGGGRLLKFVKEAKGIATAIIESSRARFSLLCFSGTIAPINGWFVYSAQKDYLKNYREIISAADDEYYIAEVGSLSASKRAVFWSIMLSPIGTKSAAVAVFNKFGLRFSEGFLSRIKILKR